MSGTKACTPRGRPGPGLTTPVIAHEFLSGHNPSTMVIVQTVDFSNQANLSPF